VEADVVVRHCTLTVRGRGGWGWGTDSSVYLAAALPAIEQTLERVLRECDLDPDADVRIEEPIRLSWSRDCTLPDELRQALVTQIRRQAESAGATQVLHTATATSAAADTNAADPPAVPPGFTAVEGARALASLLAAWSQSGRMQEIVASWPAAVVRIWLEAVRTMADGADAADLEAPAVAAIAQLALAEERWPEEQIRAEDRLLVLVAALVAAAGSRPLGRSAFEAAARLTHVAADARELPAAPSPERLADLSRGPDREEAEAEKPTRLAGTPVLGAHRRLVPGLPFLVTVQLSRIGYLDALVAAAEAVGVPTAAQVVAAGIAGKVLPPPERGWRRQLPETDAVAGVAGFAPDDIDSAAYASRGQLELTVPPLQSALISLYAAGRSGADEVVVTNTSDGAICGEADGALPIVWLLDIGDLDPVLDQLGRPPLRQADVFEPLARELACRSAFPHLNVPGAERHAGAVVGAALGSIAQELWGTEMPNAPLLALERLADLEVELRFDQVLAIAIPRGQRWLDLGRAGLLDHWAIPWAAGEHWELVSW
jgi:hypothetical protein